MGGAPEIIGGGADRGAEGKICGGQTAVAEDEGGGGREEAVEEEYC